MGVHAGTTVRQTAARLALMGRVCGGTSLAPPTAGGPLRGTLSARSMGVLQARQMGFFSKFAENIKKEMDKEEQLKKDLEDLDQSETTKRMREAKDSVSKGASAVKESASKTAESVSEDVIKPVVRPVANAASTAASKVIDGTAETIKVVRESEAYKASSRAAEKTAKAVSETVVVKTVAQGVQATQAALEDETRRREGGAYFDEPPPEVRKDHVAEEELNLDELGIVVFDAPKSPLEKKLIEIGEKLGVKDALENGIVGKTIGGISKTATGVKSALDNLGERIFPESEGGEVIRRLRERDPNFQLYPFINFLRDNVVRDITQAFLDGDIEFLKKKCGDKAYAFLKFHIAERKRAGKFPDRRILNITSVEMVKAALIEPDDVPTIVIRFHCQQVNAMYNSKGVVVSGSEDDIQAVVYAWVLQPDEKFLDLRWRINEMAVVGQFQLLS